MGKFGGADDSVEGAVEDASSDHHVAWFLGITMLRLLCASSWRRGPGSASCRHLRKTQALKHAVSTFVLVIKEKLAIGKVPRPHCIVRFLELTIKSLSSLTVHRRALTSVARFH